MKRNHLTAAQPPNCQEILYDEENTANWLVDAFERFAGWP